MPGQAVVNGLIIEKIPRELDCLNTLELVLISKRLLFKTIIIMPKEQVPKMHDSIVNVSVNASETCNHLPQSVRAAFEFLSKVNSLYQHVLISDTNINPDLSSIGKKSLESEIELEIESDNELETTSNLLNTHRHAADEYLVIENQNLLELAPGQDKLQDPKIFLNIV